MAETSPTPWTVCDGAFWRICDAANAEVVNAEGVVSEDLSERICQAVNAYDDLISVLRQVDRSLSIGLAGIADVHAVVRSALAKASSGEEG